MSDLRRVDDCGVDDPEGYFVRYEDALELERELAEANQQIAAYQVAKDNLELRLQRAESYQSE